MSDSLAVPPISFMHTRSDPHSTEIFRQYCRYNPREYYKITKIFRNLSLILLKYSNNLAMSAQNMTYAIFSKNIAKTSKCIKNSFK